MRPSALPILQQSPKFVSGVTEFSESGRDRHEALRAHFNGDDSLLNLLDDEEIEAIRWAADYIRLKAALSDHEIKWEQELLILLDDFSEMPGHLDADCGPDFFDFKWRERDYEAQMAAYALAKLQQLPPGAEVRAHLLFGQPRKAVVLKFDLESASKIVHDIIADVNAAVECRPSDYCGWCANRVPCPVLNNRAQTIAAGREDWQLEQYHASQITEPAEMAKALRLAKQVSKWAEGVEHFAEVMAIKEGKQIPGFELRPGSSKRYCFDVSGAFNASGLTAEEFLSCCQIRFGTDKKDPNKVGLENIYHRAKGLPSLAAAKRELKTKISDFVKKPEPKLKLKPIKGAVTDDDETTDE